jgi:hypothetical protein
VSRSLFALLLIAASSLPAQQRTIAIVFGPASAAPPQPALDSLAPKALDWAKTPASTVELRRTGLRDGQEFSKFMPEADIQAALADASRLAVGAPVDRFLDSLEITLSALARRPGDRSILVVLETIPVNTDVAARIQQIAGTAKSGRVQILLWDLNRTQPANESWRLLASHAGGSLSPDLPQLASLLPAPHPPSERTPQHGPVSMPEDLSKPLVRTSLFRSEAARRSGPALGSMVGIFLTEVPMASLQFAPEGSSASARVRVRQVAKNQSGEPVWTAEKEIAVKSPTSRLATRATGTLCYAREIRLPNGQYTLESTVNDLVRGVNVVSSTLLRATDTLPGLGASGMLFVKKLDKQVDVLQGDSMIQYDGVALMPVLEPVFPATVPFDLSVYFLFYPDIRGKRPTIRLDLLQNGASVSDTMLPFNDALRDDTRDGRGATSGEQKVEFPYLAKLSGVMLLPGNYEVKITIQQDTQIVTRSAPFRVADRPSAK